MVAHSTIKIFLLALPLILFTFWRFGFWINKGKPVGKFSKEKTANRCALLFSNSMAKNYHEFKRLTPLYSTEYFLSLNRANRHLCKAFRRDLFPTEVPVTDEELLFPLGFILTVYTSLNQVARLLRLIHRPHNFYVIHVDKKSPLEFYAAVQEIAKCFGANVAVVPQNESVDVHWGEYTVLEKEFVAARLLLRMGQWKYFINLTGQELPLKTNLELVLALRMLNGSNIVGATYKKRNENRLPKSRPSFPITWLKNELHVVLLREFVFFMLHDKRALELRDLLIRESYKKIPDEQFYGTLAYNPQLGAPGASLGLYKDGKVDTDFEQWPNILRYKLWSPMPCPTKRVRSICILGSQSLPDLITAPQLFANKFHEDYYPEAYSCLEYAIATRSYHGPAPNFDPSISARFLCSTHHV